MVVLPSCPHRLVEKPILFPITSHFKRLKSGSITVAGLSPLHQSSILTFFCMQAEKGNRTLEEGHSPHVFLIHLTSVWLGYPCCCSAGIGSKGEEGSLADSCLQNLGYSSNSKGSCQIMFLIGSKLPVG